LNATVGALSSPGASRDFTLRVGESEAPRDFVGAFDAHLARSGRARTTRIKYVQVVREAERRAGSRSLPELAASDLDLLLADWETELQIARGRSLSRATVRGWICALRAFYTWLDRFGLLVDERGQPRRNPMEQIAPPTVEQRPNDRLQPHEDYALLAVECNAEERIIIWLLRWTGLRVGEAVELRLGDVDLTAGQECAIVRKSKTRSGERVVPIIPELLPELQSWLATLESRGLRAPETPLLTTRLGTAMKSSFVWRVVKRVAGRAGVRVVPCTCPEPRSVRHEDCCPRTGSGENRSGVSPHSLRRTFASDLLNRGVRLEVVSKLLGHSSVAITQKAYAQLLDSTARRELLRALGHEVD
jgi:integrase